MKTKAKNKKLKILKNKMKKMKNTAEFAKTMTPIQKTLYVPVNVLAKITNTSITFASKNGSSLN